MIENNRQAQHEMEDKLRLSKEDRDKHTRFSNTLYNLKIYEKFKADKDLESKVERLMNSMIFTIKDDVAYIGIVKYYAFGTDEASNAVGDYFLKTGDGLETNTVDFMLAEVYKRLVKEKEE